MKNLENDPADRRWLSWNHKSRNLAGRVILANHFILPFVIFDFSCQPSHACFTASEGSNSVHFEIRPVNKFDAGTQNEIF